MRVRSKSLTTYIFSGPTLSWWREASCGSHRAVATPAGHRREILFDDDLGGHLDEDLDDSDCLLLRQGLGLDHRSVGDQTPDEVLDLGFDVVGVVLEQTASIHGQVDLLREMNLGTTEVLRLRVDRLRRTIDRLLTRCAPERLRGDVIEQSSVLGPGLLDRAARGAATTGLGDSHLARAVGVLHLGTRTLLLGHGYLLVLVGCKSQLCDYEMNFIIKFI